MTARKKAERELLRLAGKMDKLGLFDKVSAVHAQAIERTIGRMSDLEIASMTRMFKLSLARGASMTLRKNA